MILTPKAPVDVRVELVLPWPPSVNEYYENRKIQRGGGKSFTGRMISEEGKRYRWSVAYEVRKAKVVMVHGRLSLFVLANEPDRSRARDLDNHFKALQDAMQHASVFRNDSQLDLIQMERGDPFKGGRMIVQICRFDPPPPRGLFSGGVT